MIKCLVDKPGNWGDKPIKSVVLSSWTQCELNEAFSALFLLYFILFLLNVKSVLYLSNSVSPIKETT